VWINQREKPQPLRSTVAAFIRSSNKKGSYLKIGPLFLNTKRLGYFGERTAYVETVSWHLLVYQKLLQRF
jgi:hypothetical protein